MNSLQAFGTQAQAQIQNQNQSQCDLVENNNGMDFAQIRIEKQLTIIPQRSLELPEHLCQKTVDEVWSDIHWTQKSSSNNGNREISTQRKLTYGEMTLEDFLREAGIVKDPENLQRYFGSYKNSNDPNISCSYDALPATIPPQAPTVYHPLPLGGVVEASCYLRTSYPQQQPVVYGGGMGNGSVAGYGQVQGMNLGSLVPPSDGPPCANQGDGGRGSQKRVNDGAVDMVEERRQRRLIKSREIAARSRARKQAYRVELEAKLLQLREENIHLKETLEELEVQRKEEILSAEKLKAIRRTLSCFY